MFMDWKRVLPRVPQVADGGKKNTTLSADLIVVTIRFPAGKLHLDFLGSGEVFSAFAHRRTMKWLAAKRCPGFDAGTHE
jgi:hypothetical protein